MSSHANDPAEAQHAAELIAQADALVIAAGAGMGVDSGLPDFRGNEGFWNAYPALGRSQIAFTEVASPRTFVRDPRLAWGFYGHRLALYRATVPHSGFAMLQRWGERMLHGSFVFTSNVDGQFQKAGFDAQRTYECHGSIHHLQCLQPCGDVVWSADAFSPEVDTDACRLLGTLPHCPHCFGMARPNILMFGDAEWSDQRTGRQRARLQGWLDRVQRPVVVELGAGTAIPSVRHFVHRVLALHGGRLVRINPRESAVPSSADVGLPTGALDGLRAIDAELSAAGWLS